MINLLIFWFRQQTEEDSTESFNCRPAATESQCQWTLQWRHFDTNHGDSPPHSHQPAGPPVLSPRGAHSESDSCASSELAASSAHAATHSAAEAADGQHESSQDLFRRRQQRQQQRRVTNVSAASPPTPSNFFE